MFKKRLFILYKTLNQILENQISVMLYLQKECYLTENSKSHKKDFENIQAQLENSDILSERLRDRMHELSK